MAPTHGPRLVWSLVRFDVSRFVRLAALTAALLVLATCQVAMAQVVRVENLHGQLPFSGWKRTTIDRAPPCSIGRVGDTLFVVGRQVGLDTRVVDLHVTLPPGGKLTLNLATATPVAWMPAPVPEPKSFFGAWPPTIAGVPMAPLGVVPDGAGYLAHFRARTGRMLCTDLWLTWYPDQPGWAHGAALVTASNPGVPDLSATVPSGFALRFGRSLTVLPGRGVDATLVDQGTVFADGQARILPLLIVWPEHVSGASDWSSVSCLAQLGVGAVGIERLLADGSPSYPPAFSARAWATQHLPGCVARLHSWLPSPIGPARLSGDTGAQDDQTIVRGEAMRPDGVGCEIVTWLAALHVHASRPCNHLESDGSPLDPARHPGLLFWDGQVRHNLSTDHLGKARNVTAAEANGWYGPDVEHFFANTLAAACRYTGEPAAQQLLRNLATVYLLQRTANPGHPVSTLWSAREVGWEGILVTHLWRDLEDRAMAARVMQRFGERVERIVLPTWSNKAFDWWDVRKEVSSGVPNPPGPMTWQQALAAYGLDLGCAQLATAMPTRAAVAHAGRALALRGARRVLADAYTWNGTRWQEWDTFTVSADGSVTNRVTSGFFRTAWTPCAVATVLRHEPAHEKARAVWAQMQADTANGSRSWMPPGVQ